MTDTYRARKMLAVTIIAATTLALFGRCLTIGYMSDDFDLMAAAASPDYSLLDPFPAGSGSYFRPLVMLSLRVEHRVAGGAAPLTHHLVNLLLHFASGLLVFGLADAMTRRWSVALALSLLFLAHPAHVTNAYWISGRTDSMAAVFYLAGLLGFVLLLRSGSGIWMIATLLGCVGALLSKETGVTFAGTCAVIYLLLRHWGPEVAPLPRATSRRAVWTLMMNLAVTVLYLTYLFVRFYARNGSYLSVSARDVVETLLTVPLLLVLPNHQQLLITVYRAHPELLWLAVLTAAGACVIPIVFLWNRRRFLALAALLFVFVLIPVAPFVLLLGGISSRHMVLPLGVLCTALAGWVMATPGIHRRLVLVVALLVPPAALVSLVDGHAWVRNWQLTERYGADFRSAWGDASREQRVLVLAAPIRRGEVPLYSNDLNGALYFAVTGRFGKFPNMVSGGTIAIEKDVTEEDVVDTAQTDRGVLDVALDRDLLTLVSPDNSVPMSARSPLGQVTIAATPLGYRIELLDPSVLEGALVIYFTGREFRKLNAK